MNTETAVVSVENPTVVYFLTQWQMQIMQIT